MNPLKEYEQQLTRRELLFSSAKCLGGAALGSLVAPNLISAQPKTNAIGGLAGVPHFAPKAKRVIMLFFSGGPSHIDTYDYKPAMRKFHGEELPDSVRQGQRITTMTSGQKAFPCVAPMFKFERVGSHGTWMSETIPHIKSIADEITIIKSMNSEAINHDPAITYILTGTQQLGKPSFGSWISYGLGSPNQNLPAYVVMISRGSGAANQALYSRLWSSGFLPSKHQGVNLRSGKEPVLYLKNPEGIDQSLRRRMLDGIAKINQEQFAEFGDPETQTRISQYEMAFRMQSSVPDLMDVSKEPKTVTDMYGPDAAKPGSFARNCVLARRMAERGVPFIHLFHRGWDHHGGLPGKLPKQCKDIDQPAAALIKDLKQRGMLDETLVICGGEFGRTIYSQGRLTKNNHGRDHHGRCFTTWVAGGGFKGGYEHGQTDDHSYNIVKDPVHINDLNATLLQQMGIDHERLTYRFLGLDQRLTGVEGAKVIPQLLA